MRKEESMETIIIATLAFVAIAVWAIADVINQTKK